MFKNKSYFQDSKIEKKKHVTFYRILNERLIKKKKVIKYSKKSYKIFNIEYHIFWKL